MLAILHVWSLIIGGALCVLFAVLPDEPEYRTTTVDRLLDITFFAFGIAALIGGVRLS